MSPDELIAALKEATGPDRALDDAIATARWGERRPDGPSGGLKVLRWYCDGMQIGISPEFTKTAEVALGLLPKGWMWNVSNRAPRPHAGRAYITNGESQFAGLYAARNPKFISYEITAATPAIAVCIVCLKALAGLEEGAPSVA